MNDMALGMQCREKDYPIFKGSLAEEFLLLDIEDDMQEIMKPAALYKSRTAYSLWLPEVFRDHLYQALRDRRERPYWMARKKEKKKEKIEKRRKKIAARRRTAV